MSFQVLIALLNIALMIIIKEGSGYALQNEKKKCDSLIVGYSSIDHEIGSPSSFGTFMRFSNENSLQELRHYKAFELLEKFLNCIKLFAMVRDSNDVIGLMEFMNRLQKVASKKLIVNVQNRTNTTTLENIMINYEVNIIGEKAGEQQVTSICPVLGQRYPTVVVGLCPVHFKSPAGKEMPISYIGTPPYILGSDARGGTDIRLTNLLAERYGFVPRLKSTSQYLIMQFENGTKYGKKYQISTKQDEIGIGQWGIMDDTNGDADGFDLEYLPWMYSVQNILITPKERPVPSYNTMGKPLSLAVWAFTLGSLITVFIALLLMQKCWSLASRQPHPQDYLFKDFTLAISTLIEESPDEKQIEIGFVHSKKLMLLIWNLFGQVILMAYKSVLLGSLIAITYEKPLHTIEEVAESGLPVLLPVAWYQHLYNTDPREDMNQIGARGIIFNYAGFIPQMVWDHLDEGTAVWTSLGSWGILNQNKYHYGQAWMFFPSSWCLPKNSPLLQPLTKSIMRLQEAGILRKFYYDELNPPVYIPLPKYKIDQPIDLSMMITPFMFMGVVLLLAILIFLKEYCVGPKNPSTNIKFLKTELKLH